jgi:hypothetical protein
MRIRVEIERGTPNYKPTRSRNNRDTGRVMVIHESSVDDVKAELRSLRNGGAFSEGFWFKEARLYDAEKFAEWVRAGDSRTPPKPFQVLTDC